MHIRTVPKATLKKTPTGYAVYIGKTKVGRGMKKETSALKRELNASPRKRRVLRNAFKSLNK